MGKCAYLCRITGYGGAVADMDTSLCGGGIARAALRVLNVGCRVSLTGVLVVERKLWEYRGYIRNL